MKRDLAMTGEITLRGRVMPIGGLKEKLLAAHRSGITTVIIPKENRKDLREVPRRVLKATRIVLVEHMDEVLREALALTSTRRDVRAGARAVGVPRRGAGGDSGGKRCKRCKRQGRHGSRAGARSGSGRACGAAHAVAALSS